MHCLNHQCDHHQYVFFCWLALPPKLLPVTTRGMVLFYHSKQSYMNACFKNYQQERKEFKNSLVVEATVFSISSGTDAKRHSTTFQVVRHLTAYLIRVTLSSIIWQEKMLTFFDSIKRGVTVLANHACHSQSWCSWECRWGMRGHIVIAFHDCIGMCYQFSPRCQCYQVVPDCPCYLWRDHLRHARCNQHPLLFFFTPMLTRSISVKRLLLL